MTTEPCWSGLDIVRSVHQPPSCQLPVREPRGKARTLIRGSAAPKLPTFVNPTVGAPVIELSGGLK
jgi:hypothetical protein